MADYTVGSLGSLISGKPNVDSGPKIVFQEVRPRKRPKIVESISSKSPTISPPKEKATKIIKKVKKIKASFSNAQLKKRKPEIAGDESSDAVGKSWRYLPNRGDTSEVDGSHKPPKSESAFARNAARRVHIKNNAKKHVDDPERETRTIFVGNIPYAHADKRKLIKFFSQYGNIESLRLRCAPLKDPRSTKKVAVIKHDFHPERTNLSCYIVFKTEEQAKHALEANGSVFHAYHLRVDLAGNAKAEIDPQKSVFIGNLKFETEEEDLWNLFSSCGEIRNVRIVRDPVIGVSKGVAFVNFESSDAVELALQLDGKVVGKRPISVKRYKSHLTPARVTAADVKKSKNVGKASPIKDVSKKKKKDKRKKQRGKEETSDSVNKSGNEDLDEATDAELADAPSRTSSSRLPREDDVTKEKIKNKKTQKKSSFMGQQVKKLKKKKKRFDKNEIKKRKIASVLTGNSNARNK